ncbi:hypothetical protein [uncultured Mediterranean phage uvDeep-CGR2-KM18-C269]|jgi:hypothetical protein|nr:hypothetical protein [uncultured Mediterranean phage uvDeep-CGR2-KM18-C269]
MNKAEVDSYRSAVDSRLEELTIMNAQQNSDITYVKDTVDDIKDLVKEQNSRVRKNETSIARIQGVGSIMSIVLASFIGWLFKIRS